MFWILLIVLIVLIFLYVLWKCIIKSLIYSRKGDAEITKRMVTHNGLEEARPKSNKSSDSSDK